MKSSMLTAAIAVLLSIAVAHGQSSPTASPAASPATTSASPAAAARTDVYHVHFTKSALGKSAQLADSMKVQDPKAPMPGHMIVLRHQSGDAWDYCVIEHLGTKATVEAVRPPIPPERRDLSDWHDDTYVNGPAWADFAREMGLGDGAAKTSGSVYSVSVYRPAPGHREMLEKFLSEPPKRPEDTSSGNVLMMHLEGGPWTLLSVARYNSYQDYATNESNAVAQQTKTDAGWFKLREHAPFHRDTVTYRIAP